jgi:hypothetical protein
MLLGHPRTKEDKSLNEVFNTFFLTSNMLINQDKYLIFHFNTPMNI